MRCSDDRILCPTPRSGDFCHLRSLFPCKVTYTNNPRSPTTARLPGFLRRIRTSVCVRKQDCNLSRGWPHTFHVLDMHHFWRHFVTLAGGVAAFIVLVRRVEGCEFHSEYFVKRIRWKSVTRVCRADLNLREYQSRRDCPTRCITTGHFRHNRYVSRYVRVNSLVRTETMCFTMCTGNMCLCITDAMFHDMIAREQ